MLLALETACSGTKAERGISISGAEFTPLPPAGAGTTSMLYSNLNKGTYNTDYHYEGVPTVLANSNSLSFAYLAARGWKTVKINVAWERIGDTLSGALNSTEVARLTKELDEANSAGLKAVISLVGFGVYFLDGSLLTPPQTTGTGYRQPIGGTYVSVSAYADFWSRMTTQYLTHPAVTGFAIMNEPQANGGLTRATWYTAAQAAVTAIRAVDTTGELTIRVGGWHFSDCHAWTTNNPSGPWITDPVAPSQLWYEAHHYWSENDDGNYTSYASALAYAQSLGYTAGAYPDALYSKVITGDLHGFTGWLATYGLAGVIGEVSWPHDGDTRGNPGDQAKWNALGQAYLAECDRLSLNVQAWAAGEIYSYPGSDPLPEYGASGGQSTGLNTQFLTAPIWEGDLGPGMITVPEIIFPIPLGKNTPLNLTGLLTSLTSDEVEFLNDGTLFLAVSANSLITATQTIGKTVETQPAAPVTASIASGLNFLGPWPLDFNHPDHTVQVTFSSTDGVSVALLRVPGVL